MIAGKLPPPGRLLKLIPRVRKSNRPPNFDSINQAGEDGVLVDHHGRAVYFSQQVNLTMFHDIVGKKWNDPNVLNRIKPMTEFEIGDVELKISWKIVSPGEDTSKFLVRKALIAKLINKKDGHIGVDPKELLEVDVAMVGMHIVGWVKGHEEAIWATFEHVDNAPEFATNQDENLPVSDRNWTFYTANTKSLECNQLRDSRQSSHSARARIVVDASGKSCQLARSLGAQRRYDDKLTCVAGSFALHPDAPLGQLTVLESCSYGWWYAARLSADRAIVSVTTDAAFIHELSLDQPDSWLWHLSGTQHIAPQLGDSGFLSQHFRTFPCPSCQLDQVQGNNWLAVGDAAMSFDPLLAQGIYKALHSGIIAADQIQSGVHEGISSYVSFVKNHYSEYLRMRHQLYSQEQRFSKHPFWNRRHQPVRRFV